MLQSMGSQRVGHDLVTEQKKREGRNPLNFSTGSPFSGGSFAVILIHMLFYSALF